MIKTINTPVETFVEWAANEPHHGVDLTKEEAKMLLSYVEGHGHSVSVNEEDAIVLVDIEEPENGVVAVGIEELIEHVSIWNYEFLQDNEVAGEFREEAIKDCEMIDVLLDRMGIHIGQPLGTPTVKELIAALRNLPEDYRVTCCGADCYVHLFAKDKYITIDSEHYLT